MKFVMKFKLGILCALMVMAVTACTDDSSIAKGTPVEQDMLTEYLSSSGINNPQNMDDSSNSVIPDSSRKSVLCKTSVGGGCVFDPSGDLWDPNLENKYVQTGRYADSVWAKGVVQDGSWFWELDTLDGGKSEITWPIDIEKDNPTDFFDQLAGLCYGLCGSYTLDRGKFKYDPFVAVGFRIAKDKETGVSVPADVSNWKGICIVLYSTVDAYMELVLSDSLTEVLGYDLPRVSLPRIQNYQSMCFEWGKFSRIGWGKPIEGWEDGAAGKNAAKQLFSVRVVFQAKSGTTGNFNVMAIGSNLDVNEPR